MVAATPSLLRSDRLQVFHVGLPGFLRLLRTLPELRARGELAQLAQLAARGKRVTSDLASPVDLSRTRVIDLVSFFRGLVYVLVLHLFVKILVMTT